MESTKPRRTRKSVSLANSRWAAYATAGAATAIAGTQTAKADVHYSGLLNAVFNDSNNASGTGIVQAFALVPGASFALAHDFRTSPTTGGFAGFALAGANSAMFAGFAGATTSFRYVSRLGENQAIANQVFTTQFANYFATLATRGGFTNSQWLAAGTGFIAFKFDAGAGTQYGWARLNMDTGIRRNSFTLVDYAFADPGEALVTGQTAVPEPGSLGLLALGGAGLLVWRRRRTKNAAPQQ